MAAERKDEPRLKSLSPTQRQAKVSRAYSRFVRSMRFVLPLAALALLVVVVSWSENDSRLPPVLHTQSPAAGSALQNELISPRFESTDEKQQPFTLTAAQAAQSQANPELVELDRPMADMLLKDGSWIAAGARKGIYEQHDEKLLLQGDVELFHDDGYQLTTEELRIDMKTQQAWSGRDVYVQGPAGSIAATGLETDVGNSLLVFTGPAKLVLIAGDDSLKGMMP